MASGPLRLSRSVALPLVGFTSEGYSSESRIGLQGSRAIPIHVPRREACLWAGKEMETPGTQG